MSKDTFKTFVKDNPSLVKYVNNNTMTWQKFYEMYELYGSSNSVWDGYINNNNSIVTAKTNNVSNESAIKELVTVIKGINLEKVQKGIDNIQKTISLVQELGGNNLNTNQYETRPLYKKFED